MLFFLASAVDAVLGDLAQGVGDLGEVAASVVLVAGPLAQFVDAGGFTAQGVVVRLGAAAIGVQGFDSLSGGIVAVPGDVACWVGVTVNLAEVVVVGFTALTQGVNAGNATIQGVVALQRADAVGFDFTGFVAWDGVGDCTSENFLIDHE